MAGAQLPAVTVLIGLVLVLPLTVKYLITSHPLIMNVIKKNGSYFPQNIIKVFLCHVYTTVIDSFQVMFVFQGQQNYKLYLIQRVIKMNNNMLFPVMAQYIDTHFQ